MCVNAIDIKANMGRCLEFLHSTGREGMEQFRPKLGAEVIAIRWHMGAWRLNQDDNEEKQCYKAASQKFPLVTIIQTADTLAARIIE